MSVSSQPCAHASHKATYWEKAATNFWKENEELYKKLQLAILQDGQASETLECRARNVIARDIQEITDRQWVIAWGSRKVKLRPFLQKTAKAFERLKAIGSAVTSLDPHAAIAWAGICLLLPLVLNLSSQEQAAKTGLDEIAAKVSEWMIAEHIQQKERLDPSSGGLETAIVRLYVAILEYEAVALCFFQRRTFGRFRRSITKTDDFMGLLDDINNLELKLRNLFNVVDKSRTQAALQMIQEQQHALIQTIEDEKQKPLNMLRWLSGLEYGLDHDTVQQELEQRYLNTGQWLFGSNEFHDWDVMDHGQKRVLCLRGHVGTGKTSLACMLIEQQQRDLGNSRQTRLAYFYCSKKQYPSLTALDVLRSLLSQLSWNSEGTSLAEPIKHLHKQADQASGRGKPNVNVCVELLMTMLAQSERVTIIVDALDECAGVEDLLLSLSAIRDQACCCLRIFLTSRMHVRPVEFIPGCLEVFPTNNQDDITNFIRTEMNAHRTKLFSLRKDLEERLFDILAARAENVFKWVQLQLIIFLSPKSRMVHPVDIEARLDSLESQIGGGLPELDNSYEEIYQMNTPQPHIRKLAQAVLRWLMIPLIDVSDIRANQDALAMSRVKTTVDAISLKADGSKDPVITVDFILDICSNLVIVEEETSSFRFAHLSVVEYLWSRRMTRHNIELLEYGPSEISAQAVISSISHLNRLLREKEMPKLSRRPPLLRSNAGQHWAQSTREVPKLSTSLRTFAVFHWPTYYNAHLESSQDGGSPELLTTMFQELMLSTQPSKTFLNWVHEYTRLQRGSIIISESAKAKVPQYFDAKNLYIHNEPSRAFVAAAFGLVEVYNFIPDSEIREKNDMGVHISQVAAAQSFTYRRQRAWTRGPLRSDAVNSWLATIIRD